MKGWGLLLSSVLISISSAPLFGNYPPEVNNVTADQRANNVLIRYDLADANDDFCTISVQVSDDNGLSWDVPAVTLSSDIGVGIAPGMGKHIIWDCQADLPRIFGTDYRVRVTADDGQSVRYEVSPTFTIDNRDSAWCRGADIDLDGNVNFLDFATFVSQWLNARPTPPNDMVLIPEDEFDMGDHFDAGYPDEKPVHTVFLNSFYISRCEITNQQFCNFLNAADVKVVDGVVYAGSDSNNSRPYFSTTSAPAGCPHYGDYSQINYTGGTFNPISRDTYNMADHPVVVVSWYGATTYCNWRSRQEDYQGCYQLPIGQCNFSKTGYRLPTEAEWEYAARGGFYNPYYKFPWATNSADCTKANFWPNETACNPLALTSYPYTTPVGFYPAYGYGLCDMAGNVWEWCNDWYDANYYSYSPYDNPKGPEDSQRCVIRGGSWLNVEKLCRVALRPFGLMQPKSRSYDCGFRIVLVLD